MSSLYKHVWWIECSLMKYLPKPEIYHILYTPCIMKPTFYMQWNFLSWFFKYLYLIVRCWIFKIVSKTIGFRTSFVFGWRESEAFFSPLGGFHYRDALSFIEFTIHIKSMVFWIGSYLVTSIRTRTQVVVFLARGRECMSAINVILKSFIKKLKFI